MKRVYICTFILTVMFATAFFSYKFTTGTLSEANLRLKEISETFADDEKKRSFELAQKLVDDWNDAYPMLSLTVNHENLAEFSGEIAKIPSLISTDNDEFEPTVFALKYEIEVYLRSQAPKIYNIL